MKAPISWLKDYTDIAISPEELAEKLTLAGNEVSGISSTTPAWTGVLAAEVVAVEAHPNADRLRLVTVNTGASDQPKVVCGAPNVAVGQKVAFAAAGAKLIDGHTGKEMELKPAVIRGVESRGMVLSERELGLSDNHEGILVLPENTPVGAPLADVLGDKVLEVDVTPNRVDCLSIIGLAREAAAVIGFEKIKLTEPFGIKMPDLNYEEKGSPIADELSVEIADAELCPRYTASVVKGIKIGESPDWLKKRLTAVGMRPINNVVDITNYVMLEYGQPLHAFDLSKIAGGKIIVRRAAEGEKFITLDGEERQLTTDTLMIADAEKAVAIGGVMGGANSEVSETTADVVIESANFNPVSIHHTSHRLKLISEASIRFERNINREVPIHALKRATQLMLQLCGGQALTGIIDVFPGKKLRAGIQVSPTRFSTILGSDMTYDRILKALKALGIEWYWETTDETDYSGSETQFLRVYPPWWRTDLSIQEDIIEEVARIIGYDQLPASPLSGEIPKRVGPPIMAFKKLFRMALVGFGFQETLSLSLSSLDALKRTVSDGKLASEPVMLLNPMSSEQECLRTNLRAPLLAAVAANRRYEEGGLRLFEVGRAYHARKGTLPNEPEMVCGIIAGEAEPSGWQQSKRPFDFYDAKGVLETIFGRMNLAYTIEPGSDSGLRPGHQAQLSIGGVTFGVFGEVHPRVAKNFDIEEKVYLFEINLSALMPKVRPGRAYQPLPRYPAVVRDIALVLDSSVTHQRVGEVVSTFPLLKEVSLFDVYSGKQVSEGKKSLAYRLTFQSPTATLTDAEVDRVMADIVSALMSQLGATLRA
ncbi:phenylalanine--tRNA ligase subunit beta [Dehalogenimonas alkenigignens]|uniref:phenylalanine--tRNA ligase subunit beta n=1 Tax=Dehalogenimonas alkenigignens TaxID=1217799 RepID=UPI000D5694FE|nr:phenylalanine--tRNA ligase subunit beta [Dehalogenimonas alkenigignens]PVV83738.1 phenylalanine--tRNA ligase subunit beta [Dehalogenimonas alkenigignens]